jgi:D-alanyl-lipoteichoic acid acyltransferase DltB (MBOAT superfamily)
VGRRTALYRSAVFRPFGIQQHGGWTRIPVRASHPWELQFTYKSLDPSDFWRRWHISLSSCLRDYVYIPLGGNRYGELKTYRNLMLTMMIGGLWRGANWTFVVRGAYHGVLLASYRRFGAE